MVKTGKFAGKASRKAVGPAGADEHGLTGRGINDSSLETWESAAISAL
jgi:hypothetical protein